MFSCPFSSVVPRRISSIHTAAFGSVTTVIECEEGADFAAAVRFCEKTLVEITETNKTTQTICKEIFERIFFSSSKSSDLKSTN